MNPALYGLVRKPDSTGSTDSISSIMISQTEGRCFPFMPGNGAKQEIRDGNRMGRIRMLQNHCHRQRLQ